MLAAVVGSGIMGDRLDNGNVAIALLANTVATGATLVALILTFGPISGAHLNPAVTLADAWQHGISWRQVPAYVLAQVGGAFVGVAAAHLMFDEELFSASRHIRSGGAQMFSEFVATFGLLAVIWGCARSRSSVVPFAVGGLHNRVVHGFNIVCEPGCYCGPVLHEHVRRYSACRCRIYCGSTRRGIGSDGAMYLVDSVPPR